VTVLDPATTADALDVLSDVPLWTLTPSRWDAVTHDLGALAEAVRHKEPGDARAAVDRLLLAEPSRVTPIGEGLVVSPADGRVSLIVNAVPPAELQLGETPLPRVSIFMSVFDCHVNRAPVGGRIERIAYRPGKFLNADLDKASEDNERNGLVIATPSWRVGVVQIAGLIAKRIVCWTKEGQEVGAGERFGMIRFGSRLDVYLPVGSVPLVSEGQTSLAGETVLADLSSATRTRSFRVG